MRINEIIALMIGAVGVLNLTKLNTKIQVFILKVVMVVGCLSIWFESF